MEDHEKIHTCKQCGETFPCGRSLGGHMRSHLIPFPSSSSHHHHHHKTTYDEKLPEKSLSSLSSPKGSTLLDHVLVKNPKKINEPSKTCEEYSSTQIINNLSSSSLSDASNYSPPISNIIDQQEEEEVALSLIILSQDKGEWDCTIDPVFELSDDSSGFLDPKTTLTIKEIGKSRSKTRKLDVLGGKSAEKRIKSSHKHLDFGKESEFKCSVCNKAFSSYQALGGHRASHKKFNGSCAPRSKAPFKVNSEDNKAHVCSICYRVFPSGQALGGHKRSHLAVADREAKKKEIWKFFDLNLPAPDNEEE